MYTYDYTIIRVEGEKLLILGGTALTSDIVHEAKKLGVRTIVTDWNSPEKSPAKNVADEYAMVSLSDMDGLEKLIMSHNISGVLTGYSDSYLEYYQKICKKMGLPCYLDGDAIAMTKSKDLFKRQCDKYGLGTIPGFCCTNESELSCVNFEKWGKVIVKPVDNSGSRGISVCSNFDELHDAYHNALDYSSSKLVLVEKYMECDDVSVAYVLSDGEIKLSAICDRYVHHSYNGSSVTSGLIYPSKYLNRYLQEADSIIKRMLLESGYKNGVLFLQLFADEQAFYFYEMGYRLSGGRHYISTDKINNSNAIRMLISYAITGNMNIDDEFIQEDADFEMQCIQICLLCRSAKIGKITGIDAISILPEVINCGQYYSEGDLVGGEGTTAQIVFRIHACVQKKEEIISIVNKIKSLVTISDQYGEDMILDFWNPPLAE